MMQGLLLKDWYTLLKQMKIMLGILVIFACMPGYSMSAFAVFYAAMLPVTALAYDERSKWDELAVMMPYSVRDIVLSKYLLGLMAVGVAAVVASAAQLVINLVRHITFDPAEMLALLLVLCMSLILLSINLPLMFRMGVEKGRIAFLILVCGGVAACMALRDNLIAALNSLSSITLPTVVILLVTAAIMVASVPVSMRQYKRRRG